MFAERPSINVGFLLLQNRTGTNAVQNPLLRYRNMSS